jgi:hypothetical protein
MKNSAINLPTSSIAILLAGLCTSAHASVVQYTSQTSYLSASASLTHSTINFEGIASPNSDVAFNNSNGLTLDNVNFVRFDTTGGSYDLKVENIPTNWSSGAYLDGPAFFNSSNPAGISVTLPPGVFAIGTNIMALGVDPGTGGPASDAANYKIVLSTGATVYTISSIAGYSSMAFVGFTSDTAITSLTFYPQSAADRTVLDNFDIGQGSGSSATPEAGTSLLCGGGLILMVRLLRRRASAPQLSA